MSHDILTMDNLVFIVIIFAFFKVYYFKTKCHWL